MYSCRLRSELPAQKWDAFVERSSEAWLWHTHAIASAVSCWDGKSDLSFALVEGDHLRLVLPLYLVKRTWLGKTICRLESLGGPAYCPTLSPKQKKKVTAAFLEQLDQIKSRFRVWRTQFILSPLSPNLMEPTAPKVNPLLHIGFQNDLGQSWLVDLRQTPEQLFSRYSKTTRNEIRKVEKSGVIIREASSEADLQIYYDLHTKTYHRNGNRPHPKRYFEKIFSEFIPTKQARILFLEREGVVRVAQNTGYYKKGAYYWTGASDSDKVAGETKYLCHLQMLYAKSLGCHYYEIGEAYPQIQRGKLRGLSDFKKSFGGELFPFYKGFQETDSLPAQLLIRGYDLWRDRRQFNL